MLGILGVPVADDHRRASHRDILILGLRHAVQHLVEVDNVAIVALLDVHLVEAAEANDAGSDLVFGEDLLSRHGVRVIYASKLQLLLEVTEGLLLAVGKRCPVYIYRIGAIPGRAYVVQEIEGVVSLAGTGGPLVEDTEDHAAVAVLHEEVHHDLVDLSPICLDVTHYRFRCSSVFRWTE